MVVFGLYKGMGSGQAVEGFFKVPFLCVFVVFAICFVFSRFFFGSGVTSGLGELMLHVSL